jgi:large subunit ribosomal protein L24
MLWDSKSDAPSRISRAKEDGRSVRIAKKSGEEIK